MSSLPAPPHQTLDLRDVNPPPSVELRNWSGTRLLQLDLSTYPPRVISVLDTGSTATSLPLGELPVLPPVVNPLRRPLSLQNVRALRSNRTSSPPNLCIEPSMLHAPGSPTTAISRPISPIELEPPPSSPPDPSPRPPTPPTP